jgi:hypothetical protein
LRSILSRQRKRRDDDQKKCNAYKFRAGHLFPCSV